MLARWKQAQRSVRTNGAEFAQILAEASRERAALIDAGERVRDYIRQAKSPNTLRAYRSDWADFTAWCEGSGLAALPAVPETVALYLAGIADRCKASTVERRISAISQAHQAAGHEPPTRDARVRAVCESTIAWASPSSRPRCPSPSRSTFRAAPRRRGPRTRTRGSGTPPSVAETLCRKS